MSQKKYFSYIRVSTQRQGQHGTSLTEQQAAIEQYANSWNLKIVKRFEERETAAKQGRPIFLEMLKQLRKGLANGVVIHKIDRSARNLKDWADLGSLIDAGLEVHFASESLDLNSRGGRLSADIQAVVASDYIRNLREESKKGIYGRLKQGYYPFPAVLGYLDCGKARPKSIDPVAGPFIRMAFESYATGNYSLASLADLMSKRGLISKRGKKVGINAISMILRNPFYVGVIRIQKRGEFYTGVHTPLISKRTFDRVQNILNGKSIKKDKVHFFLYRRMIRCEKCESYLVAERQKGNVYYRCHTSKCSSSCLKEETVETKLEESFKRIGFTTAELSLLRQISEAEMTSMKNTGEDGRKAIEIQQKQVTDRLSKLADGYIDGIFDKEAYSEKKAELIFKQRELASNLSNMADLDDVRRTRFEEFLELANSAYLCSKSAYPEEKRDLVKSLTSNLIANGKSVSIKLKIPFDIVARRPSFHSGAPQRDACRTISAWVRELLKILLQNPLREPSSDLELDP
jgi:site-specific DNA recombinase